MLGISSMYQHHWKMQFWSKFKTNSVLRLYSKSSQSPDSHKYGGCCYSVLYYRVNWWPLESSLVPIFNSNTMWGPHVCCWRRGLPFFTTANWNLVLVLWLRFFLGNKKSTFTRKKAFCWQMKTVENRILIYNRYLKYEIKMSTM